MNQCTINRNERRRNFGMNLTTAHLSSDPWASVCLNGAHVYSCCCIAGPLDRNYCLKWQSASQTSFHASRFKTLPWRSENVLWGDGDVFRCRWRRWRSVATRLLLWFRLISEGLSCRLTNCCFRATYSIARSPSVPRPSSHAHTSPPSLSPRLGFAFGAPDSQKLLSHERERESLYVCEREIEHDYYFSQSERESVCARWRVRCVWERG